MIDPGDLEGKWAQRVRGPERTLGQNDGKIFRACTECGGVRDEGIASKVFPPGQIGHQKSCSQFGL